VAIFFELNFITESALEGVSRPKLKDTVHFYYMISFPFKNEAPISANSAHDDPVSFRLGNGECFGAIEQCSM